MSEKRGIFSFFKGWGTVSEVEKQQRDYALAKEKEEQAPRDGEADRRSSDGEAVVSDEIEQFCIEKLEELLDKAGFAGKVRLKRKTGDRLHLEIFDSGDDAGRIIGKAGRTLESLQILVRNFVIRRFNTPIKVNVDAGEYRNRRFSQIKSRALKAAEDVSQGAGKIVLDPMTASERRVIHVLFENDEKVKSISEGDGDDRHVALVRRDEF